MQLKLSGHHLEITPALRSAVEKKLERIVRHFDSVIDIHVTLTVDKLEHKAEATLHVSGADLHAVGVDANMYAAIDTLAVKLDRAVKKHKEKLQDHHASEARKSARL